MLWIHFNCWIILLNHIYWKSVWEVMCFSMWLGQHSETHACPPSLIAIAWQTQPLHSNRFCMEGPTCCSLAPMYWFILSWRVKFPKVTVYVPILCAFAFYGYMHSKILFWERTTHYMQSANYHFWSVIRCLFWQVFLCIELRISWKYMRHWVCLNSVGSAKMKRNYTTFSSGTLFLLVSVVITF